MQTRKILRRTVLGITAVFVSVGAKADPVVITKLVSDLPGAAVTDANLVNPWGVSFSAGSPFWVSNNGTGTSTLYNVNPITNATAKLGLTVAIPGAGSVTGQVFNTATGTGAFNADNFLFVSEDGTISGWRGALGTTAETLVAGSANNVYKGSAFEVLGGHAYLFGANFRTGAIDVVKGDSAAPNLAGTFTDAGIPAGYAPFNVQNIGGTIYVTYAKQDAAKHDEVAGAGLGFVDAFDQNGNFLRRIAGGGLLNAPWGVAIAPSSFGTLAGKLLVGNFGDGRISTYDPLTGVSSGLVTDAAGNPISIDGLWALTPGNGAGAGSASQIYFTAGIEGESHGLFGSIASVPEPSPMVLGGLTALAGFAYRLRRPSMRA